MTTLRERQDEVQKRFVDFVEKDPRPIFEADRQGRILYLNPAARDRFPDLLEKGLKHELLGDWSDLLARLDREPTHPLTRTIQAANRPFEEWIHRSPDGARIRFHVHDVTARERDIEVVRRFDLMAQKVPELMSLIDGAYVYLAANESYCRAHKLRRESVVGRSVAQVWGEQIFNSVIKGHLDRCLRGEEVEHQLWIDFPGVGRRHVDVRYLPATEPRTGKPLAIVVTRDITRILESEDALRRHEKREALGRMTAGIARILADALTTLEKRGPTGLTGGSDPAIAPLRELMEGLRAFTESPRLAENSYELKTVVDGALRLAAPELPKHVRVKVESGNIPMLTGDARMLEEILKRLVVAGGRAMSRASGGENRIVIESWQENDLVKIAIADAGPAIPDHLRTAIFEPFHEGLGERSSFALAICRVLAERIGGTLELPSAAREGTQFILTIPLRTSVRAAEGMTPGGEKKLLAPQRRAAIVVIDDDPTVGSTIRGVIAEEHDIVSFTSGQDALRHFERIPPVDIIFCDLMMPGMSGEEVFRAIEAQWPDFAARVVFLTGGITSPQLDRFIASVPNRRCGKPPGAAALKKLIGEMLA
jgi:PAS domain S-box-containing protein